MNMSKLVCYHKDCVDGFGSAFAAWLKLGDEGVEYKPLSYADFDPVNIVNLVSGREVYLLDLSPPREIVDMVIRHASKMVWLDHHKPSLDSWIGGGSGILDIGKNFEIILDSSKSGALLSGEYFNKEERTPVLFRDIDDYDRWVKCRLTSEPIYAGLMADRPWNFKKWRKYLEGSFYYELMSDGDAILRAHYPMVEAALVNAESCVVGGFEGLACNCSDTLTNDVGAALAEKSGTYGLCWYRKNDGSIKASFRSKPGFDVNELAKRYKGGGHTTAAGAYMSVLDLLEVLNGQSQSS